MLSNFHLPLNPIDKVNQPPVSYLQVQDGLILCSGLCWTTAYILYIRQAYRDKSYGMPLVCLYVPHPSSDNIELTHPWGLIDALI